MLIFSLLGYIERLKFCYRSLRSYCLGLVSEINENLFLSSASAVNTDTLEVLDVNCLINVAAELPDTPLENRSIIYYKIDVFDSMSSDLSGYFDDTADIIHNVSEHKYITNIIYNIIFYKI